MGSALLAAALREDGSALPGAGNADVQAARSQARARLQLRGGLAHAHSERWRYMPVRALEAQSLSAGEAPVSAVEPMGVPRVAGPRLVFADGYFAPSMSDLRALPPGAVGLSLADLDDGQWARYAQLLQLADTEDELDALNLAQARGGFVLDVSAGSVLDAPLEIIHVGNAATPIATHVRCLVRMGAGASVTLRERHVGGGSGLATVSTRWILEEGAMLHVVQQQQAGASLSLLRRDEFRLAARSTLRLHALELGAALSRRDLSIRLDGEDACAEVRQVALTDGRQHSELALDLRHAVGGTRSELRCRAVASARARAVLHGAITIEAGADRSDASLDTRNLLLSESAEIDVRPTMEIHADEVRAAHGASVGQIDPGMMFYLRSRGLSQSQARAMLVAAHCRALLEDIVHPVLRADAEAALDAVVADWPSGGQLA